MNISFTSLTPTNYPTILPYFSERPTECCESDFLYHIIWKDYYNTQFCVVPTGLLWLQKIDKYNPAALLPLSKKDELKETFHILQDYFTHSLHVKLALFLVDEEALELISPNQEKYQIIEDIDSSDYIYLAEKLKLLSGKKYHKKKNHINAFIKEHGAHFEYRTLTANDAKEILAFAHNWVLSKNSDDEFHRLESEEIGLKNLLESAFPNLRMAGIYIDNKLEAFTAGTYNSTHQMAIIHLEKANDQIRGLYPFINQQFLIHAFPEAVYVNREDDMGIASLRKAKESYYPIKMTKKYTILEK